MNTKIESDLESTSFEKCVICSKNTDVPTSEHIDFRKYYIEGGGQLCEQCYINLDTKKYIRL